MPCPTPLITPAAVVATAVLLLLQVPPAGVLASVVVRPSQTDEVPVMFVGTGLTVAMAVLKQEASM